MTAPPRYMPYAHARLSRRPGTHPLDPANWIETGPDHEAQMAERDRILADIPEAAMAVPGSEAAVAELGTVLRDALAGREDHAVLAGAIRRPDGETVPLGGPPLTVIGRLVQEDFCVLEKPHSDAEYVLTAAVLCFPSRWRLADKMGRPLTAIHAGVPDYTDDIPHRVNRLFDGIAPERPLWRANWSIHDRATLRQTAPPRNPPPTDALFIRVERQTFRRLPRSRAVVFGIRTHIDPLDAVPPDAARALVRSLDAQSDAEIAYRGGRAIHDLALRRLRAIAA